MSVDSGGNKLKVDDFVICVIPYHKELVLGRVFKLTPKGATIDTEIEEAIMFYDFEAIPETLCKQIGIGSKRITRTSKQIYKVD